MLPTICRGLHNTWHLFFFFYFFTWVTAGYSLMSLSSDGEFFMAAPRPCCRFPWGLCSQGLNLAQLYLISYCKCNKHCSTRDGAVPKVWLKCSESLWDNDNEIITMLKCKHIPSLLLGWQSKYDLAKYNIKRGALEAALPVSESWMCTTHWDVTCVSLDFTRISFSHNI